MYRALLSFTTKNYDVRKNQILDDDFATADEIQEFLSIGYIEEYDGSIEITENGVYNVEEYDTADVNVSGGGTPTLQNKSITINENGSSSITYDSGYDGLDTVSITTNVPQGITPTGTISITENGTDIDVSSYATANVNVSGGGGGGAKLAPASISFKANTSSTLDLTNLDYSNLTTAFEMFRQCSNVTSLDLRGFVGTGITDFSFMFNACSKVTTIRLDDLTNGANVNCEKMFLACVKLRNLYMQNFDFTAISNSTSMFGSSTFNYVSEDCYIYVKDAIQKAWFTTNFPRLTRVTIYP